MKQIFPLTLAKFFSPSKLLLFFFNLQFFFIHNDKPKNTNSAVIHKQALYHNTAISLV